MVQKTHSAYKSVDCLCADPRVCTPLETIALEYQRMYVPVFWFKREY